MSVTMKIELPEANTYGELMKGYLTLMRVFGFELAAVCTSVLNLKYGNWRFQKMVDERREQEKLRGHPVLRDATVVLKEIAYETNSPIREALPASNQTVAGAKKIISDRNVLLHFGEEPSLDQIAQAAELIQLFARAYSLKTDAATVPLLTRLHRIKRGQHVTTAAPTPAHTPAPVVTRPGSPPPAEPPAEVEITAELPRPKIGGVWEGALPAGEYRITKTGDLVSTATADSLRNRVTGDFEAKIRAWLAPRPKGNLWIAEDGAIGGYVAAVPRLLGYLGEEPPGEIARGFLLPQYYEVHDSRVRNIDTGGEHNLPAGVSVADGSLLRLTTYGDLIRIDEDGVDRIAVVDQREWEQCR